ncbi:MAG: ATP-binding protein [Parascardovia denticolens]
MEAEEIHEIIERMRQIGNDTQDWEVKEAAKKLPTTFVDTLSAFSNTQGGTVILGVSEKNGFTPVPGFRARRMQDAVSEACQKLTPRVRPIIEVVPFEGSNILVAQVPAMRPADRPCYITTRGIYQGSFVRTGDGDHKLTAYEIDRMLEMKEQPLFDNDLIPGAEVSDLDPDLLGPFLARQKGLHPHVFADKSDLWILSGLHVLRPDGKTHRPTLGGLMALGTFPQQFQPRLNVIICQEGKDDRTIIGPIPLMVADAVDEVTKRAKAPGGRESQGTGDRESQGHGASDYPVTVLREAITNALVHRDYSPEARSFPVKISLFDDRIEILNPGGLYGNITAESLVDARVSPARNQYLANILETTPAVGGGYVLAHRGSGYHAMSQELKSALLPPPSPISTLAYFQLTLYKSSPSLGINGDQRLCL